MTIKIVLYISVISPPGDRNILFFFSVLFLIIIIICLCVGVYDVCI